MSLLQMSFSGAVLILAIVMIRAMAINRLPKRIFIVLWNIALLRLLLPVSIPSTFSVYSLIGRNTSVSEMLAETPVNTLIPQVVTGQPTIHVTGDALQPLNNGGMHLSVRSIIWGAGVLLCLAYFVVSYIACRREFRTSLPVKNDYVESWLGSHRLRRTVTIRQTSRIAAPLTYGIFCPVILMPKKTDWENEQQLNYILLHEYIHICHFDAAFKLVATLVLCIHWFNPLVWVLYILFNRDIELACDEQVVRRLGPNARAFYARTLITMEEKQSTLRPLCNNFSKTAIEERITAIMKTRKLTISILSLGVILVAAIAIMFTTSAQSAEIEDEVGLPIEEDIPMTLLMEEEGQDGEYLMDYYPNNPNETVESSQGHFRADTKTFTFIKEGMEEKKAATQYVGEGYFIWLPEGEWQANDTNEWVSVYNEQVRLGVICYKDTGADSVVVQLSAEGYQAVHGEMTKVENGIVYKAKLYEVPGSSIWGVLYCYPEEAEEGWGAELPVIASTFAVGETWLSQGSARDFENVPGIVADALGDMTPNSVMERIDQHLDGEWVMDYLPMSAD